MIQLRMFDPEKDYETVKGWWESRGLAALPVGAMPMLGAMAMNEGMPLCAEWLYMDNSSPVAFLTWPVSNPDSPKRHVVKGFLLATQYLEREAEANGYSVIFAMTERETVGRIYEKAGFGKTALVHEYVKEVKGGK